MSGNLEQLLEDGVIDEVLSRLKSGKEADVWLVRHRDEVLAAKVYKERAHRSFKNNAGYKEGRTVRNTRTQRAMDRGSRFGQEAAEEAWKSAESDALHRLHAQGVRVPAPVLFYEGILLMKLVLDAEGQPAPRLIDVAFEAEAAAEAYADLRAQAVRMLCSDLIHGDLSAYNVLMAAEGPTIIDFPQVISAAQNSTAAEFFKRDIENLRTFFAGFEPSLATRNGDGPEIWQAYVRRELTPEFVPSGRPVREPAPRAERRPDHASPRPHPGKNPGGRAQGPRERGPERAGQQGRPQQGAPSPARHGRASEAAQPASQPGPQKHAPSRPPRHAMAPQGAQPLVPQERPRQGEGAQQGGAQHGGAQRVSHDSLERPRHDGRPHPAAPGRTHSGPQARPEQGARPPDGAQRPEGAPRPQHAPRPEGAQRPHHPPRPEGAQRSQHPPRPEGAQRPQHPPRPEGAQRPQHPPRPEGAQRPQHRDSQAAGGPARPSPQPHSPAGAQASRQNPRLPGRPAGALARPRNPPRPAPVVERIQRPAQPGAKPFPPPGRRPLPQ